MSEAQPPAAEAAIDASGIVHERRGDRCHTCSHATCTVVEWPCPDISSPPWAPLMDTVHGLIVEAAPDCPEHDDDPLCYSIATGLWLEGWRPAPPPTTASTAAEVLAGLRGEMTAIRARWDEISDGASHRANMNFYKGVGISKAIALVEAAQRRLGDDERGREQ